MRHYSNTQALLDSSVKTDLQASVEEVERALFIGRCDSLRAEDLDAFDESRHDITYRTFLRHVGRETVRELNKSFGVPLRKDWHVSYAKGTWEGQPAVCLFHSRYHHIWVLR